MTGQAGTVEWRARIGCRLLRGTAGTSRSDAKGEAQAANNRKARVPTRSTGADRSVLAKKARNGAGAKGSGQAGVRSKQLETGGRRWVRQESRSLSIRSKCTRPTKRSNPKVVQRARMVRRSSSSKPT